MNEDVKSVALSLTAAFIYEFARRLATKLLPNPLKQGKHWPKLCLASHFAMWSAVSIVATVYWPEFAIYAISTSLVILGLIT